MKQQIGYDLILISRHQTANMQRLFGGWSEDELVNLSMLLSLLWFTTILWIDVDNIMRFMGLLTLLFKLFNILHYTTRKCYSDLYLTLIFSPLRRTSLQPVMISYLSNTIACEATITDESKWTKQVDFLSFIIVFSQGKSKLFLFYFYFLTFC